MGSKNKTPRLAYTLAISSFAALAPTVPALQFPSIDPGYSQEIYTGALQPGEGGFAWTSAGNLLTRTGSTINEYDLSQTANLHQGTNAHAVLNTHSITNLANTGVGMSNGLDGYVYTNTGSGLYRFNPSNWAAPAQQVSFIAGLYGITTLPDGRIAYTDSAASGSNVYIYNPSLNTNTLIYTAPTNELIDGMAAGPTGEIALAGQTGQSLYIISPTGSLIKAVTGLAHFPDGLCFSPNVAAGRIYSNNNDGSITRYDFGPGYTGTPTITDITSGGQDYGDLAAAGPDCAFYVSAYSQTFAYHGCTPNVGTNWDNAVTNSEGSYTRITAQILNPDGSVSPLCDFYSPLEGSFAAPEPASLALLAFAVPLLLSVRRRKTEPAA